MVALRKVQPYICEHPSVKGNPLIYHPSFALDSYMMQIMSVVMSLQWIGHQRALNKGVEKDSVALLVFNLGAR